MNGLEKKYNLVIVGAGLSGSVVAERASKMLGLKSLVIDKRDHIGGNCYDYIDEHGIRTSQYGVHIFHTKYDKVRDYVKQFSDFTPYEHKVVGNVKVGPSQVFTRLPVVIISCCQCCQLSLLSRVARTKTTWPR